MTQCVTVTVSSCQHTHSHPQLVLAVWLCTHSLTVTLHTVCEAVCDCLVVSTHAVTDTDGPHSS